MRNAIRGAVLGCVLTAVACSASPRVAGGPTMPATPGGPSLAAAPQPPGRFVELNLLDEGLDASIKAPVRAQVLRGVEGVRIERKPGFSLEVLPRPVDLESRRAAIQNDRRRPLKAMHAEFDDALVYEAGVLDEPEASSFHFVARIETGGRVYTCQDTRTERFSYDEVLTMLRACWSLQAREPLAEPEALPPETPEAPDVRPGLVPGEEPPAPVPPTDTPLSP